MAVQLFENTNFLVVDKRPGFLSVPSRLGDKDERPCEISEWSKLKEARLWAVHRLDEEVSGVLLFAKTAEAHRIANGWFENRLVHKMYEALTESAESKFKINEKQIWKSRLLRGKKRAYERDFGKESVTEATFLGNGLWRLSPLTGRSHQLRFELAKHGFPVLGDELYGSKTASVIPGAIALRSIELDFSDCSERLALGLPEKVRAEGVPQWWKEKAP
ncbi:MAG: pseudouridine synthase [Pseudomonadota bacterium]